MRNVVLPTIALGALTALTGTGVVPGWGMEGSAGTPEAEPQTAAVPYDGRFTFTRIRYAPPTGGRGRTRS